jgi:hypothetical protein
MHVNGFPAYCYFFHSTLQTGLCFAGTLARSVQEQKGTKLNNKVMYMRGEALAMPIKCCIGQ